MLETSGLGPCCSALLAYLGSQVFTPGTHGYNDSVSSYFATQGQSLLPQCIVRPEDTSAVSTAVALLVNGAAQGPQCNFAVRSGGHGTTLGAANIAGGVTIDLRSLDNVTLAGSVASIGPGTTWDSVYDSLAPHGLSVAGGRTAGVGVGGLTTGGGISFLSPRYGWTADTVLAFEVVLASPPGQVVTASATSHPDLLWALRGGSNNFGVVTRIDMQAFPQGDLWGGMTYYELDQVGPLLDALAAFGEPATYDPYASVILSLALGAGQPPLIVTNLEYTRPEPDPPALQDFTAIPSIYSTLRLANMTSLSLEIASATSASRAVFFSVTVLSTREALEAIYTRWSASVPPVQNVAGISWALSLEPVPPAIYERAAGGAANALGLGPRNGGKTLVVVLLSAGWADAADDATVEGTARDLHDAIVADARRLRVLDPFIYLNYAAAWQDPIASYGAENVKRLKAVQAKYDPSGTFSRKVPGGFKIPEYTPHVNRHGEL